MTSDGVSPTQQVIGQPGPPDLFSVLRNVVFLISVYIYFVGWLYAYYLFFHFGVSLNSVEIPVYYFFVYSYSVFTTLDGLRILLVAILLIVVFLRVPSNPNKTGMVVVCALLFPALFYTARTEAENEARSRRMGHAKTISFVLKPEAAKLCSTTFMLLNRRGELRLLTQTKDRYYVFYQPEGEKEELPYATVFDISRSDVLLAKIEVQNVSTLDLSR